MTYHAGIGFGCAPRDPHVTCDGCDTVAPCLRPGGSPYSWVLARKAPPGWKLVRIEEPFSRKDWCKACKPHMVPADLNLVRITGLYLGGAPNGFDPEHQRLDGDWQKYFARKGWGIARCPVAHPFSVGCSTCDPYHGAIAVKVST